jgi:hypothetical protein
MTSTSDYRLIMTAVSVVCGLAVLCSVWPALDVWLTALLLGSLGVPVAGYLGREAVREMRFRRDMRALDRRDAARAAVLTGGTR